MGVLARLQRTLDTWRPAAERVPGPVPVPEPGRVLIVDDDPAVLDAAERLFMAEGYLPISTGTPQAALQIARSMRPVAIFLDVLMPEFDGWDALAALKADPDTRDIPVVMISMLGERERALYAGAEGVIPKPLDAGKLRAAMARIAAQSSSR